MAERRAKRTKAKVPARTENSLSKPAGPVAVGSEEWRAEVRKARERILGGRPADLSIRLERVAERIAEHDEAARRGDVEKCKEIRVWLTDQTGRNGDWQCADENGKVPTWERAICAVLLDIRRRLDTVIARLPEKETRA